MCYSNINSDVFYAYVKEVLLESIPNNSVIVLDNATFHKRKDIQNLIMSNNHQLLYLPPYSSELNPIEKNGLILKLLEKNLDLILKILYCTLFRVCYISIV